MKKIVIAFSILALTITGLFFFNQQSAKKLTMDDYQYLTFDELEEKIDSGEEFVTMYGWVEGCGDTVNFDENYLIPKSIEHEQFLNTYIIDLDIELPEGLIDKEKREPMKERFGVFYGPTLVHYNNGEIVTFLEWTPAITDDTYGMMPSSIDHFFKQVGWLD